jgi:hypothetical protein
MIASAAMERIRRAVKARGHFPNEPAALKWRLPRGERSRAVPAIGRHAGGHELIGGHVQERLLKRALQPFGQRRLA